MVDGLVRWRRKEFSWVVLKKDQTSEKVKNSVVDRLYQTKKKKIRSEDMTPSVIT